MLQSLPAEILQMILHHVLYPIDCFISYYFDFDNSYYWTQRNGLNFSSTCKVLREHLAPILWQPTFLYVTGPAERETSSDFTLFSRAPRANSYEATSFLDFWSEDLDETPTAFYSSIGRDGTFLNYHKIMDSVLRYVTGLKIGTGAVQLCSKRRNESIRRTEALHRYLFAIKLVSPKMMPSLKNFKLDMLLDKKTNEAHCDLGRVLGAYKSINIKLSLSAAFRECNRLDDNFSFIDLIFPS